MVVSLLLLLLFIIIIIISIIIIDIDSMVLERGATRVPGARTRLGEHKPGRIKPGRIKRAALSLQHQNGYTFDVCRVKHPGTKQLPIHISGAGFAPNSQIWFLGTTPFDTTPFICL